MKVWTILLILASLTFASVSWVADTQSTITTQPLIVNNRIVVGTEDGTLYAFSPASGSRSWDVALEGYVEDAILFGGDIIALTRNGKVVRVRSLGQIVWSIDLQAQRMSQNMMYGLSDGGLVIYATSDMGVIRINPTNGNATLFYPSDGPLTPPYFSDPYLLVGVQEELLLFRPPGNTVRWRKTLGPLWASPAIHQGNVVIGSLDNQIYSLQVSSGTENWHIPTGGWVTQAPLTEGDSVFLGSNDGYLYAISLHSGETNWRGQIGGAVSTPAVRTSLEGQPIVLVGSQNHRVYAFDQQNGWLLWTWEASDAVTALAVHQEKLLVGTRNGKLYSYTLDQGCTITAPSSNVQIGQKPVKLEGYAFPLGANVEISINSEPWQTVAQGGTWSHRVEPASLRDGSNLIACRTSLGGISQQDPFLISVIKDSTSPPGTLLISYPLEVMVGDPINITVIDGETYEPVGEFEFVAGDDFFLLGDESGNLIIPTDTGRTIDATIRQEGYSDGRITIHVRNPGDISVLLLPVAGLVLVGGGLGYYLFKKYKKPTETS